MTAAASSSRVCPVPVVGVIGGIGSGKSSVTRWVAERHPALVIDADALGHQALDEPAVRERLRAAFGDAVFAADGLVMRSALGRLVFGDSDAQRSARRTLENIVHPEIRRAMEGQLAAVDASTFQYVLLDAAVLLEAGWSDRCDAIVFVDTPEPQRIARVAQRGWTAAELSRREASQWPLSKKRNAATEIVRNEGSLDEAGAALWSILQQQLPIRS